MSRRLYNTQTSGIIARALVMSLLIGMLAFFSSCGDDINFGRIDSISDKADKNQKKDVAEEPKGPALEKDYVYTSIGKRDPFKSIFDDVTSAGDDTDDVAGIVSQLQNYDVNSFVVTAIVWGISSPTAMVEAPDGETYVVKTGTLMGRNWGRVIKIKRDRIVVLETKSLPSGDKVSHMIELQLPVKMLKSQESQLNISDDIGTDEEM